MGRGQEFHFSNLNVLTLPPGIFWEEPEGGLVSPSLALPTKYVVRELKPKFDMLSLPPSIFRGELEGGLELEGV